MKHFKELEVIAKKLALAGIKIGAIKIRPENPFTWASGWKSPIYNDNRMFLFFPEYRKLITEGLEMLLGHHSRYFTEIIAGTSTAGIPHADRLAERLQLPEIYVRDKPKDHGMKNQIEGIDAEKDLEGKRIVLIEDLISTAGSSAKAVQALRDANGHCTLCLSIFSYGFPIAQKMFNGEVSFEKTADKKLEVPCHVDSILEYPLLLETAIEEKYISSEHEQLLKSWSADPEKWSNDWKVAHQEEQVSA